MTSHRKPHPPQHEPHLPKRIHAVPVIDEDALDPDETLNEAASELGLNDWIDPETGEPAEGESPPRLDGE